MMVRKLLFALVLIMTVAIASPVGVLMAAEPPGADPKEKIIGPTMWAVCVIDCADSSSANIRIKKIEGCDVDTQAVTELSLAQQIVVCPPPEGEIVYTRFSSQENLFGLPCQAIVTKVKNYKVEGNGTLVSFDAQIQFVVLDTDNRTECQ